MNSIWSYTSGYKALKWLVDLGVRTSFSSLKTEGKENIPTDCAIIFAPNHSNALMDPLLLLRETKNGPMAFGARADMFKSPKAAAMLRWLHIVPLARMRDGAKSVEQNYKIFDEIADCLKHGVPFCLFCEGTHRISREIMPCRKGIFRISDIAAAQLDKPLKIVPVGLNYECHTQYFKKMTVKFGEAINYADIADWSPLKKEELLHDRIQALVDPEPQPRRHGQIALRTLASLLSLPLFAVCAVVASPMTITAWAILRKEEDKAWTNTIHFACSFPLFVLWPFHRGFFFFLHMYQNLINDIKK